VARGVTADGRLELVKGVSRLRLHAGVELLERPQLRLAPRACAGNGAETWLWSDWEIDGFGKF